MDKSNSNDEFQLVGDPRRADEIAVFSIAGGFRGASGSGVVWVEPVQATKRLVRTDEVVGGVASVKKSCKLPLMRQKKGRHTVREIRGAHISLIVGSHVLENDYIGDETDIRCQVDTGFDYAVVAGRTPLQATGVVVEVLANGGAWKVIHSGRIPGPSFYVGEVRPVSFHARFSIFDFLVADHLRITMNGDHYYA